MAWIEITEDHLLANGLSGAELEAYRAAALATDQADPVQPAIDQVTDLIRGYVGGCRQNTLGTGNTIPQKLLLTAVDLLAVRIPQRVGRDPKAVRRAAYDAGIKLLEQVAACKFSVEEPEEASEEAGSSITPTYEERTLKYSRADQDGI